MTKVRIWANRLLGHFRPRRLDEELDEEVRFHLEMLAAENERNGLDSEAARRAAHREFGGLAQMKENYRDKRGLPWLETFMQDCRSAVRNTRRYPIACIVTILSLGFGIGGVTATFTFMKAVILNPPLLYDAPKELFKVSLFSPDRRESQGVPSSAYSVFADRQGLFTSIAAAANIRSRNIRIGGREQSMPVQSVTPSLLPLLGVTPLLGRPFMDEDARMGAPPVVLLSHRVWKRDFQANPQVLGETVPLDGIAHTIIGVLPERYYFASTGTSMWTPLVISATTPAATDQPLDVILRAPLVSERALVLALHEDLAEYRQQLPPHGSDDIIRVRPIYATTVREALDLTRSFQAAGAVFLTVFAVLLTLLITCANVAIVMVAQWTSREQETAVRAMLGAGRMRIVRMLVFETLIIASCAGLLGVAATAVLRGAVLRFAQDSVFFDFSLDLSVLVIASSVTLLSGLLAGVIPALMETRKMQLNPERLSHGSFSRHRFRSALVVGEITVVIALLVVVAAMVNSYYRIMTAGSEFRIDRLVTLRVESQSGVRIDDIVGLLRTLPGVESVAAGSSVPFFNFNPDQNVMSTSGSNRLPSGVTYVGSEFFRTIGMPLIRGRGFSGEDDRRDAHVAIVNEALARRLWPESDPMGQHIGVDGKPSEVVAVLADYVSVFMTTPAPAIFLPLSQKTGPIHSQQFLVKASGDPTGLLVSLRSEIMKIGSDQAASRITTVKREVEQGAAEMLVGVYIFLPLVCVGLLLSAAGMYGILAFTINRRAKELAIRVAVGANARDMLWLVVSQTCRLVVAGTGVGTLLMFWLMRTAQHESVVFAKPTVSMFFVPVVILLVTSAIATWVPARRAMSVDPAMTLRADR